METQIGPTLSLSNPPVMIASGTFGYDGYGRCIEKEHLEGVSAVVLKTLTMEPLTGNPEPRWYPDKWNKAPREELLINSVGLTNPGIHRGLQKVPPMFPNTKLVISILGKNIPEFEIMANLVKNWSQTGITRTNIFGIELNLSCPNIGGYLDIANQRPEIIKELFVRVLHRSEMTVIVKLPPSIDKIVEYARIAKEAGVHAVTVCNTIPAIRMVDGMPVVATFTGGLSGYALHPIALGLVDKVLDYVDIPVIGCGGVFNVRDAQDFMDVGATAVQVGSAMLQDFNVARNIVEGWDE